MQQSFESPQIVITGIGIVSPFGTRVRDFQTGNQEKRQVIGPPKRFSVGNDCSALCAEVPPFSVAGADSRFERLPLISQYSVLAAEEAFGMSQVGAQDGYSERTGVYYGSCYGPGEASVNFHEDLIDKGPTTVKPLLFQETVFNAPSALIAIRNNIKGPHIALANGSVSGAAAIQMAFHALKTGEIDYALVGASDVVTPMLFDTFVRLNYLAGVGTPNTAATYNADKSSRMVLGEGSGFIVMERAESAKRRGVQILAVIAGVTLTHDAYVPFGNNPTGEGMAESIRAALTMAEASPEHVELIMLAANNTYPLNQAEERALRSVLGPRYDQVAKKKVKDLIGETAAAGIFMNLAAALDEMSEDSTAATLSGRHALCLAAHYSGPQAAVVIRDFVPSAINTNKYQTSL